LTDLHGGSVHVESDVGKGSRFTLNLPWGQEIIAQLELIESDGVLEPKAQTPRSSAPLDETSGEESFCWLKTMRPTSSRSVNTSKVMGMKL
jgi:hypothetical protein